MPNTDANAPKTPLDFIADAYWDDFIQNRPIDNGALLEDDLRQCHLDGSVMSLFRVDKFLDKVRDQNSMRPDIFMQTSHSRNLTLFIGFYMGQVLLEALNNVDPQYKQNEQQQTTGHWLGQAQLKQQFPHLKIHPNNPFHFMALLIINPPIQLSPNDKTEDSKPINAINDNLFFVLEPIALKIFAAKLKMPPVVAEHISPSVFMAVVNKLPAEEKRKVIALAKKTYPKPAKSASSSAANVNQSGVEQEVTSQENTDQQVTNKDDSRQIQATNPPSGPTESQPVNVHQLATSLASNSKPDSAPDSTAYNSIIQTDSAQTNTDQTNTDQTNTDTTAHKQNLVLKKSKLEEGTAASFLTTETATTATAKEVLLKDKAIKHNNPLEAFYPLQGELESLPVAQDNADQSLADMYQRAAKVLNQIDKRLNNAYESGMTTEQRMLDAKTQTVFNQALSIVNKAADKGYTAAMLRLSIYYFLGEGVEKDEQKGFELVQKAADLGDIRAMRQLSRLYYKGLGCEQNIETGRQWLEKAAENGHSEAGELVESWQIAQTLIDETKSEDTDNQRYYMLLGAIVVIVLLIVILL